MSSVDERIVRMQFDNTGFEAGATKATEILGKLDEALKFDGAAAGLESVQRSMSGFNMDSVADAVNASKSHFSAFEEFSIGVFRRIGETVVDFSASMAKRIGDSLTAGAKDGFTEYELQIKSLQTISANSGEDMSVITANLDELNEYADKTIYNFSEMTANIGRFTAAGLGVEESTKAIKGFANMAALAGAGTNETSRGMYQLSQAMAAGVVKLQDWKSIQNASIDTAAFKDILIETARVMGTEVDAAIEEQGSFNASLSEGWLTADVMAQALEVATMSTRDFADEEAGLQERMKQMAALGYSDEVAKKLIGIANAADDSAREVRTWSQLVETVKEGIGSGWARTWNLIIGDFDEATELFTTISQRVDGIVGAMADARNNMLQVWKDSGGRDALVGILANLAEMIARVIIPLKDAFAEVFGFGGEQLAVFTENIARFIESIIPSVDAMNGMNSVFFDVLTVAKSIIGVLLNAGRVLFDFASNVLSAIGPFEPILTILIPLLLRFNPIVRGALLAFTLFRTGLEGTFTANLIGKIATFANKLHVLSDSWQDSIGEFLNSAIISKIQGFSNKFSAFLTNNSAHIEYAKKKWDEGFASLQSGLSKFRQVLEVVFKSTDIYKTISGWFDSVKAFFSNLIPNSFLANFKLFGHGITWYIVTPARKFAEFMKKFDSVSGDTMVTWIHKVVDIINGPLNLAFGVVKIGVETVANLVSGPLTSAIRFIVDTIHNGFSLFNPFAALLDLINNFEFRNPLEGVEIPSFLSDRIDAFKNEFSELSENTDASTESIKKWIKTAGTKIKTSGKNTLTSVLTTLSNTYDKLTKYFSKFKGSGKSFTGILSTVFSDIVSEFKSWLTKISLSSDAVVSSIGQALSYVFGILETIPGTIKAWFNETADTVSDASEGIAKGAEDAANNAKTGINGIIDNLPSISEIIVKIGTFFGNIKDEIVKGFTELFTGSDANSSEVTSSLASIFDFSWVKITFPDLATPVSEFVESFSGILDAFPTDKVEELFGDNGHVTTWAKNIGKLWLYWNGNKWLNSLTVFNKGLGHQAESLGDLFANLPDALKTGMTDLGKNFGKGGWSGAFGTAATELTKGLTNFGKAFDPLGKKSKAKAFLQISEGILMLAGAMFVLAKVPADDLNRVAQALAQMGIAVAGFALFVGWLAKLTGSDLQAVGTAVAGFGVGLLGLVGALWLFTKIPLADIESHFEHFLSLIFMLGVAVALANIGGGNLFGAAAAFVAMAAAMTMMLIPIEVLGHTRTGVLNAAIEALGWIEGIMTGCIFLLSQVASDAWTIAAGGLAMVAMAAAMTMMLIPIEVLGHTRTGVLNAAIEALGWIEGIMTGCISILSLVSGHGNALSILAATVAMFGLVAATTMMIVPVYILGRIPIGILNQGRDNVAAIGLIMSGLIGILSIVSTNALGLAGAAIGMMLMDVAIAGLVAIVAALSFITKINGDAVKQSVETIGWVVAYIEALALTGLLGASGLLALAGAILAFSVSLVALGAGILALQTLIDWGQLTSGMSNFTQTLAEMGGNIVAGIRDAIANAPGELVYLVNDMFNSFVTALEDVFDMHSPSKVMEEEGDNIIQGLLNGIGNSIGELMGSGEETGDNFLEGIDLADIPGKLAETAANAVNSFVENIDTDVIEQKGMAVVTGFLDGLEGEVYTRVEAFPQKLFDSLVGGIKSLFGIKSPSTVMKTQGSYVTEGFINGLDDQSLFDRLGNTVDSLKNEVLNGLAGLPGAVGLIGTESSTELSGLEMEFSQSGTSSVESFVSSISNNASSAKRSSEELVTNSKNGLLTLAATLKSKADEGVDAFSSALSAGKTMAARATEVIVSSVKSNLGSLYSSFYNVGSNGIQGFINGLSSRMGALYDKARAIGKSALDAIKKALGIASPSKEFRKVGVFSMEGLILGLESQEHALLSEGETLANAIPDAFENALTALSVDVDDLIDADYNPVITPVIDPAQFDSGMGYLNSVINSGLSNMLPIGDMDYNAQFSGKIDDLLDSNKQAINAFATNQIDYNLLGISVANALIASGVHVEIDGGGLMGYLAGEIQDARRMYS